MSNAFYSPLQITLYPANILRLFCHVLIGVAMGCIVFAQIHDGLRLGLLLVLLYKIRCWRDQQQQINSWRSLSRHSDGLWWLYKTDGSKQVLLFCQASYLSPQLIIMRVLSEQQPVYLLLWRYHYPLGVFRRASMYLQLQSRTNKQNPHGLR